MAAGRENLLHAYSSCSDPDCEIHHPEVIEDYDSRATAKAWYSVAMWEFIEGVQGMLRDAHDRTNPAWDMIEAMERRMKDEHNLTEFVEVVR